MAVTLFKSPPPPRFSESLKMSKFPIATHAYLKNDIAVQIYLIDCPSKCEKANV